MDKVDHVVIRGLAMTSSYQTVLAGVARGLERIYPPVHEEDGEGMLRRLDAESEAFLDQQHASDKRGA